MLSPNQEQCLLVWAKAHPKLLLLPCPTEGLQREVSEGWDWGDSRDLMAPWQLIWQWPGSPCACSRFFLGCLAVEGSPGGRPELQDVPPGMGVEGSSPQAWQGRGAIWGISV